MLRLIVLFQKIFQIQILFQKPKKILFSIIGFVKMPSSNMKSANKQRGSPSKEVKRKKKKEPKAGKIIIRKPLYAYYLMTKICVISNISLII